MFLNPKPDFDDVITQSYLNFLKFRKFVVLNPRSPPVAMSQTVIYADHRPIDGWTGFGGTDVEIKLRTSSVCVLHIFATS